ncbi:hypothetical protein OHC33_007505 [Knufia fluminis]|uniref:Uncharacterized protein n=1 Tax=Knufia fluminis TaxID=191047 RepID=A0AAN8EBH4_9EURO|nr:hypothetical protein OHC33_007505 [Knufia fluminis]
MSNSNRSIKYDTTGFQDRASLLKAARDSISSSRSQIDVSLAKLTSGLGAKLSVSDVGSKNTTAYGKVSSASRTVDYDQNQWHARAALLAECNSNMSMGRLQFTVDAFDLIKGLGAKLSVTEEDTDNEKPSKAPSLSWCANAASVAYYDTGFPGGGNIIQNPQPLFRHGRMGQPTPARETRSYVYSPRKRRMSDRVSSDDDLLSESPSESLRKRGRTLGGYSAGTGKRETCKKEEE